MNHAKHKLNCMNIRGPDMRVITYFVVASLCSYYYHGVAAEKQPVITDKTY